MKKTRRTYKNIFRNYYFLIYSPVFYFECITYTRNTSRVRQVITNFFEEMKGAI